MGETVSANAGHAISDQRCNRNRIVPGASLTPTLPGGKGRTERPLPAIAGSRRIPLAIP